MDILGIRFSNQNGGWAKRTCNSVMALGLSHYNPCAFEGYSPNVNEYACVWMECTLGKQKNISVWLAPARSEERGARGICSALGQGAQGTGAWGKEEGQTVSPGNITSILL